MTNQADPAVTPALLADVCSAIETHVNDRLRAQYPETFELHRQIVAFELGKRYARIVIKNEGRAHGSAYGFVDLTNGDMFKSAGWKGPTKNFARGNVLTQERAVWLKCCGYAGIG